MSGKQFLEKHTSRLCRYPPGQKFHQYCSILHRFRDECVFALYAEIQDGCQKWRENNFWKKSPKDSANSLQFQKFVKIALSRTVSEINAFLRFMQKFKTAAKKLMENNFWEKSQVDSADTLPVQNFVKISLSGTVIEINTFLCFAQKFKMAAKKWWENNFLF